MKIQPKPETTMTEKITKGVKGVKKTVTNIRKRAYISSIQAERQMRTLPRR
jgi:hypothetical protein